MLTEWLLALGAPGGYLLSVGVVYRQYYIHTYKKYRRWQAEKPNGEARIYRDIGFGYGHKRREDVSYHSWFDVLGVHDLRPGQAAFGWPVFLAYKAGRKLLRPEVKVPDYSKIKELENVGREI